MAAGKMYWTDSDTVQIHRANLNGSTVEDLVPPDLDASGGIALDTAAGKMYWAEALGQKIYRANLDGSEVEDLEIDELGGPAHLALDAAAAIAAGGLVGTNADGIINKLLCRRNGYRNRRRTRRSSRHEPRDRLHLILERRSHRPANQ